ncbi:MAG TPA: family 10 glycosylhydrolase [Gemmatimonadota bacterium]
MHPIASLLLLFLTLASAPPAPGPPAAAVRTPRALWVVRNTLESREETERAVEDCVRIGCSLLFLQVSGRWDAYTPSPIFPPGESLAQPPEDNLAYAIRLAHSRGVRVHAWVNALLAWSAPDPPRDPRHVFRAHPDWFLVGPDGRSVVRLSRRELDASRLDGYFLEPALPQVRTELRRFILDLVTRYDLDGVHLDYIRFPAAGYGFQPEIRARYRAETGIDPADLYARGTALAADKGEAWLAEERARWEAWHRAAVTRLVRLIRQDLRAVRPGLELSAAVLADPRSARDDFGQDWAAWIDEGLLDLAVPMVYRPSAKQVLQLLDAISRVVDPRTKLFAGVSLEYLDAREVAPVEALMGRYGADGLAIFSYNMVRADRKVLSRLAQPARVAPAEAGGGPARSP